MRVAAQLTCYHINAPGHGCDLYRRPPILTRKIPRAWVFLAQFLKNAGVRDFRIDFVSASALLGPAARLRAISHVP